MKKVIVFLATMLFLTLGSIIVVSCGVGIGMLTNPTSTFQLSWKAVFYLDVIVIFFTYSDDLIPAFHSIIYKLAGTLKPSPLPVTKFGEDELHEMLLRLRRLLKTPLLGLGGMEIEQFIKVVASSIVASTDNWNTINLIVNDIDNTCYQLAKAKGYIVEPTPAPGRPLDEEINEHLNEMENGQEKHEVPISEPSNPTAAVS